MFGVVDSAVWKQRVAILMFQFWSKSARFGRNRPALDKIVPLLLKQAKFGESSPNWPISVQVRVELSHILPNLAKFGQVRSKFARLRPDLNKLGPKFDRSWSTLVEVGHFLSNLAEFGRTRPGHILICQIWSNAAQFWAMPHQFGRSRSRAFCEFRPFATTVVSRPMS